MKQPTQTSADEPIPALVWPILLFARRVRRGLARVRRSGRIRLTPNLWQLSLGVARMWHRILFRFDSIGTDAPGARRTTLRARLLHVRPLRFPFLLRERAIAPLDMTGLASSRERTIRHLLGAYHGRREFAYDLELLACDPGALAELERRVRAVVERDDARNRWLRDLVVYEGYHERLLDAVRIVRAGQPLLDAVEARNPDTSFVAYLGWCAAQPSTPRETWRAWRRGDYRIAHGARQRDAGDVLDGAERC